MKSIWDRPAGIRLLSRSQALAGQTEEICTEAISTGSLTRPEIAQAVVTALLKEKGVSYCPGQESMRPLTGNGSMTSWRKGFAAGLTWSCFTI